MLLSLNLRIYVGHFYGATARDCKNSCNSLGLEVIESIHVHSRCRIKQEPVTHLIG